MQTSHPRASCKMLKLACGNLASHCEDAYCFIQHSCHDVPATVDFIPDFIIANFTDNARMRIAHHSILRSVLDLSECSLTLETTETPRFLSRSDVTDTWFRESSIVGWEHHKEEVSFCRAYAIYFDLQNFHRVTSALGKTSFRVLQAPLSVTHKESMSSDDFVSVEDFESRLHKLRCEAPSVPYSFLFRAAALARSGKMDPTTGSRILDRARSLLNQADIGTPAITAFLYEQFTEALPEASQSFNQVQNASFNNLADANRRALVLKALVTPTRTVLQGPDLEIKNRVLRKYSRESDHFLRVAFADEDGGDLPFNDKISNDEIFERFRSTLLRGITVAGRRFKFLGFSQSSLRTHSAWFCADFVDQALVLQDCQSILRSLGDFTGLRVPAKCAARIGQAFSETPIALSLKKAGITIRYIADVKNSAGTRVFSDGVGTISPRALQEVWNCLPERLRRPTCIQIRIAGIKGMLSLDPRLRDKSIRVRRESMEKFPSKDLDDLGICDVGSKPMRFVLNRQFIKILEDLNVSDRWFFSLQTKAIEDLSNAASTCRQTANLLRQYDAGTSLHLPRLLEKLDKIGIDGRRNNLVRSVTGQVLFYGLRSVKYKSRLPVSKGVTLFGVMDETSFLKDGQIYVTFELSDISGSAHIETAPATGRALVTRSPALHPGDIQCVQIVSPPPGHALLQLKNCVVFSSEGSRDLPSMLSGGDLDGDQYGVIWDPDAIPEVPFPPAHYPRLNPKPLSRPVNQKDIAEFFVEFMKSDILGVVATRHQVYADVKTLGTRDLECIRLAEMHSAAVDYSKSGIPIKADSIPKPLMQRPDFLSPAPSLTMRSSEVSGYFEELSTCICESEMSFVQPGSGIYPSKKLLGRLFREIDEARIWRECIQPKLSAQSDGVWDSLLRQTESLFSGLGISLDWRPKLSMAKKLRTMYDQALAGILCQFSLDTKGHLSEIEAFSGYTLNVARGQSRRQRDCSPKLADRLEELTTATSDTVRQWGNDEFEKNKSSTTGTTDEWRRQQYLVELCASCLVEGNSVQTTRDSTFTSFAVLAANLLLDESESLKGVINA